MPRATPTFELLRALEDAGGVAEHAVLAAATSRSAVRTAARAGHIVRLAHGLYASPRVAAASRSIACRPWAREREEPSPDEALAAAGLLAVARARRAVLSHRSAAIAHGWPLFVDPTVPEVVVPRDRRRVDRAGVIVRRRTVSPEERRVGVTAPTRTVLDCAGVLPFAEALAVADSALRSGRVGPGELVQGASGVPGRGGERALRVAEAADARAANPFESSLRAILLDVEGLRLVPQVAIDLGGGTARVDLADRALGIVVEADSYEFHGGRSAFVADIERYDALVAAGWLVVRVTMRHVRERPDWVRDTVRAVMYERRHRSRVAISTPPPVA